MQNDIQAHNHANHIVVHYPMYCGFSSKRFRPCTLHSGLCYISDPCWPDMHDRNTSGVSTDCTQGLPKVLCRKLSCHALYSKFMIRFLQKVEQEYGKNFDFLKQHASSHVFQDIRDKGTTDNSSTRTGEGFQQEAAQAYEQTNMKNAEHQVSVFNSRRCSEASKLPF